MGGEGGKGSRRGGQKRTGRWKEEEGRERRKRRIRNSRSFLAVIQRELEVKTLNLVSEGRKKRKERKQSSSLSVFRAYRYWERESEGGQVVDGVSYVLQSNSVAAVHDRLFRISQ